MVRIKKIGKSKPNGTRKPSDPAKSPAQPVELSDADRARIKSWLDKQEKPFGIATASSSSKKRKRTSTTSLFQLQTDLFEQRLNIEYEVRPRDKWECLRRYKKFTVGAESIGVGQCILVKHDDSEDAKIDLAAQWKAKVLEVRALDSEHVYIRVAWLNRPEDLPSGRKAWHGSHELVPTNQMDVIDAMAVNGSVEVVHWDERDDESEIMKEDEFFWRQTYDFANTKTFSTLRTICIDSTPQNPDQMILQCGSPDCRQWQHVKCIAEAAVQEAADESSSSSSSSNNRPTPTIPARSLAQAKAETHSFAAELFLKDLPGGSGRVERTEIVVTAPRGERWAREVCCLFCGKVVE